MPPTGGRGPHEAVQTGFDNRPESHLAPAIHPRQTFRDSLSDGEDTFIDDTGKELEDSPAAHAHALRIIEKMRQFIPDGDKSTWKIRIISASGQSVLTVISRGVEELPQRPFGRRVVNDSQKPSL